MLRLTGNIKTSTTAAPIQTPQISQICAKDRMKEQKVANAKEISNYIMFMCMHVHIENRANKPK